MKKIKFGVIGCSKIAAKATIPAIISSKNAELHIIGSRSKDRAKEYADKYDCKLCGDYGDVIGSDADAVYISLPTGLHEKWATIAAQAGKHILCEKSAAISLKSAQKMVGVCKKNKVRILEGLMFRYHPQHNKVLELIKKGSVGKIYTFFGNFCLPMPKSEDIRHNKDLGGGVLNDAGCYPVSASRMIFREEPIEVTSTLVFDSEHQIDVRVDALLKYPGNKNAHINAGYGMEYAASYRLLGSNALIDVNKAYSMPKDYAPKILFQSHNKKKVIAIKPADQFRIMIDTFCDEIKIKHSEMDFELELLNQAKVMDAIRISAKKKKTVKLH